MAELVLYIGQAVALRQREAGKGMPENVGIAAVDPCGPFALRPGARGVLECWGFIPQGRLRHPMWLGWASETGVSRANGRSRGHDRPRSRSMSGPHGWDRPIPAVPSHRTVTSCLRRPTRRETCFGAARVLRSDVVKEAANWPPESWF